MINKGIKLGIFAVALLSFSLSSAQNRDQKTPPTFEELIEKMDKNEDGKLSEDEVEGPLKDMFSEIDTDEDGFITEEEFENAPKPKGPRK
ncbi:EF-hand domain-containing protein [Cellulophaga baltica]|uniref:EF-hand domain-containing protein n=1 Tax=Cellulophaga TaxID=104264 RepID=UPI001C069B6D|nr:MULTISPECIES: EF-hand domain-containing protein [Cellulophaga]MBU2996254.1 EF-hand domain-containing protein [Cellulophaga baltica]MDO6767649.1 EF-hand domain-containing protein [Cellulophaga sp. 1_MG-2023]